MHLLYVFEVDLEKIPKIEHSTAHLSDHHPEHRGDSDAIVFSVSKTGPSPLLRQVREAVQFANTFPTQVMNSRAEYLRPVIQRLTHTDLIPDDNRNRGQGA